MLAVCFGTNDSRNSILMTCHYQIWVVPLIGWKFASTNEKTDTRFIALLRMYLWRSKTTLDSLKKISMYLIRNRPWLSLLHCHLPLPSLYDVL